MNSHAITCWPTLTSWLTTLLSSLILFFCFSRPLHSHAQSICQHATANTRNQRFRALQVRGNYFGFELVSVVALRFCPKTIYITHLWLIFRHHFLSLIHI